MEIRKVTVQTVTKVTEKTVVYRNSLGILTVLKLTRTSVETIVRRIEGNSRNGFTIVTLLRSTEKSDAAVVQRIIGV